MQQECIKNPEHEAPPPYEAVSSAPPPPAYYQPPMPETYNQAPMSSPGYGSVPPNYTGYTVMQPATAVVINQPMMTTTYVSAFGKTPINTICPRCNANIITSIDFKVGTFTWLIAGALCLTGCDLGCCLIPFCVDGCKEVVHSCPNCSVMLGHYSRL